ncbi:MAG TPA: 7TM diverse intracellular signaling domain-containing protein [Ramlibacter sp.]|uniref:sensor domain-containing diguanylate cyclase n=1 Tax=Ramlibacter sp. TaxID=1917967 RepID=UPI002D7F0C80|nr:7TM diverse intracellular signaling domain-containing protein [Ramlibacter sp.]HET8745289.1 7TM diverse intracellular signaling domain-containing protein [Ramlibacter sp.]
MTRRGWTLHAWCVLWLWIALSWAAVGAHAADAEAHPALPRVTVDGSTETLLSERSLYWIDESGSLSIDQVQARADDLPWRVRRRENQRAPAGTLWITFEAVTPPGLPWFLEIGASVNDRVQLFYRRSGAWVLQQAGTGLDVAEWPVPGRLPTFALSPDAGQPVRYWLRVDDSHGDFAAPLALLRQDVLLKHRELEEFVLGCYFGVLVLVAFASLVNGLAFRDRASLVFAVCILLLGLGQLGRSGLGGQHLWPEMSRLNDAALELWPGAGVAAGLWLVKIMADPARLSRGLDLGVWGLIAALLGATAVHMVVDNAASLTLVLSLSGLALVAVLSMVLWGWLGSRDRHLRLVAMAFAPLVILALFPLGRDLGLLPASVLTRFGAYFGTLLALPMVYYAVNMRLMARREAELRANALVRADPLTGLPHLQAMTERLESSLLHARAQRQNCALLCIRLSNLETIQEEFGREAVDKALVITASHLRRLSAGYDMAARVGPREFALLMEAPATREAAISRAQQLVACGLREVAALPGVLLRYHVTWTLLPRPRLDGAATVQWAVDGLDQITPETRKAIRSMEMMEESALR